MCESALPHGFSKPTMRASSEEPLLAAASSFVQSNCCPVGRLLADPIQQSQLQLPRTNFVHFVGGPPSENLRAQPLEAAIGALSNDGPTGGARFTLVSGSRAQLRRKLVTADHDAIDRSLTTGSWPETNVGPARPATLSLVVVFLSICVGFVQPPLCDAYKPM